MAVGGYYYLHRNGQLLYRRLSPTIIEDFENSDLVTCYWPVDPADRAGAWKILIESSARGADPERVAHLADMWLCTDEDARIFAAREGVELTIEAGQFVATLDGRTGRGDHALDAFVALFFEHTTH